MDAFGYSFDPIRAMAANADSGNSGSSSFYGHTLLDLRSALSQQATFLKWPNLIKRQLSPKAGSSLSHDPRQRLVSSGSAPCWLIQHSFSAFSCCMQFNSELLTRESCAKAARRPVHPMPSLICISDLLTRKKPRLAFVILSPSFAGRGVHRSLSRRSCSHVAFMPLPRTFVSFVSHYHYKSL